MTKENRAAERACPECATKPILQADGNAFCDICNRYMETATLVI